MFHAKLENADLASLKDMILERSQAILDKLEGSHTTVNRQQWSQQSRAQYNRGYQTSQHNRGFQARPPPERRSYQRQSQRPDGATRRSHTPSPTRAPRNPDHYCFRCLRDPQRKHEASTHFFRQCPTIPRKERDFLALLYDKALQHRSNPKESWPKKIMGQTVSVKLMNAVEDFYGLNEPQEYDDL